MICLNQHDKKFWTDIRHKSLLLIPAAFCVVFIWASPALSGERLAVNSETANIRSGPGTEYDVLWQIERYHPVLVIEKKGNWYKFKDFEGDIGWIHSSLLDKMETVVSIKEKCNVRGGPDTSYEIVFTVEKGVPFKVLKKDGNWFNIEHADGDAGWIHSSLVW